MHYSSPDDESRMESADATMIVKYVTKMTAATHNQTVIFMPKPLFGEAGNSMHFHQGRRTAGRGSPAS